VTRAVSVVAIVLLVAATAPAAAQCVMCKTALTSSPEGQAIGAQFNRAILLMLFAPYVVAAAFVGMVWRRRIVGALLRALHRSAPAR
jgi:hypothetical protein